jgi:hypothetical protein
MGEIKPAGQNDAATPVAEAMPAQEWPEEPAPTDGQPVNVGSTTGTSKGEEPTEPSKSPR